ncbi:phage portal protein [Candidatus Avelusimicrobium faecicola]|uniref:phage portal protein n=1 Tax=Candidatus Avelusimicrobium faecicola TaxID=3416205 RepID=UPI0015A09A36
MNILQKLKQKFFTSGAGRVWQIISGGPNIKAGPNSFLATNIRAIATACCNGELKLYKADGEEVSYERKTKDPLLDLLYQPSPYFNENIFKQIYACQMLIYGNVYFLKNGRDNRGRPTSLIPIPAPCVSIRKDGRGYPIGYRVTTTNGATNFELTDIIHIYEGNAYDLFEGFPRAKLCELDAEIMNAAKVFNLAFFKNGASVGGVITFPEGVRGVRKEDKEEILRAFNDMHAGAEKAHRTAILEQGGKYESFKTSHKDMEFAEGQRYSQQQIFSAMGVPPALVGLFEFAPQFNTKEQQKIFYETTIIPLMRLLSDAINENLIPDFYKDESVYMAYDFSRVKALEEDWLTKAQALQILAQKFPLNECKRALGLPFSDVAGGDEVPDPILSAFGSLSAPAMQHKGVKKLRIIEPTDAQQRAHKAAKLKLYEELGPVMEEAMKKHFSNQHKLVKDWLENGNKDTALTYDAVFGSQKDQVKALLLLKIPALSTIFNAGLEFEKGYVQSLNPNKDFRFTGKKDMQDRVRFWAEKYALKWADSIEHTTLKDLDAIIKTLVKNGESNETINRAVLAFFSENGYEPTDDANGQTVYNRVRTIVQTETLATISESALDAYRSTPYVTGKKWISTKGVIDHHVGHLEMDGQTVGINELFINPITGDETEAPGRFGLADQDINCLCDIGPQVLEEE